jgi:hypothetical protein
VGGIKSEFSSLTPSFCPVKKKIHQDKLFINFKNSLESVEICWSQTFVKSNVTPFSFVKKKIVVACCEQEVRHSFRDKNVQYCLDWF